MKLDIQTFYSRENQLLYFYYYSYYYLTLNYNVTTTKGNVDVDDSINRCQNAAGGVTTVTTQRILSETEEAWCCVCRSFRSEGKLRFNVFINKYSIDENITDITWKTHKVIRFFIF